MKPNGGPAFPQGTLDATRGYAQVTAAAYCGMSLRDYFAAQAAAQLVTRTRDRQFVHTADEMAAQAYEIADAMLAEREKINGA